MSMSPDPRLEPWLNKVTQGDCLKVLDDLPARSVDAVVTDPPYFLPAQHYASRKRWPRSLADLSILEHFYRDVVAKIRRALKEPGHCLFFCDGQSYPVFYAVAYPYFATITALVWDKGRFGLGSPWRYQHEFIMAANDSGAAVTAPHGTVFKHPVTPSVDRVHPAEKPLDLMRQLVALVCPPDGVVLDPFAGAATTGVACLLEGRHCIMIEQDAAYHATAVARLASEMGEQRDGPLFAACASGA